MTLDEFITKWLGQKCDLLSAIRRSGKWHVSLGKSTIVSVDYRVFSPSYYLKILNSIIKFIPVYMMNYFRTFKFSSQEPFHYKSMFPISLKIYTTIKEGVFPFTYAAFPSWMMSNILSDKFLMAVSSTKVKFSSSLPTPKSNKSFPAVITLENTTTGFVIAGSTAVPSFLTGRSLKFITTLFTNVFHKTHYSTQCAEGSI